MKSLMSLLTVGCLLAVGAAATAADKPFAGFKSRGASGPQIEASLGPAQTSADYAYQNAPPPAPASEELIVPPQPMPEGVSSTTTMEPVPMAANSAPLFECVKYRHLHEVHPCAVEMIVSIKDPCACDDPCSCCEPKCVNVRVCAPPCGCPEIKCNKDGSRVKYDYGKYAFEVVSRRGTVTVTYDD